MKIVSYLHGSYVCIHLVLHSFFPTVFFDLIVFDIFSFSLFSAILFAFYLKSLSRLMNTRTQEVIYFYFVQFA